VNRSPRFADRAAAALRCSGGRAGFTIVELLVAIMIFGVGALALAATSATILEMSGNSNRRVVAASLAQSQFEVARSLNCKKLEPGSNTVRGIEYSWSVSKTPNATDPRVADVKLTVTVPERGAARVYTFRNVFPC
jgi:prepilin-type N-terminal cleavage/methylation domain-containing protein